MKLQNKLTGATLELPPPDSMGASCIRINGEVVEHLLYSDVTDTVTTGAGREFKSGSSEFNDFVLGLLWNYAEPK